MRRILILAVIFVSLIGWRLGVYYQTISLDFCDGCQIHKTLRWWTEPERYYWGWRWHGQGMIYVCRDEATGCGRLSEYRWGDQVWVEGRMTTNEYGSEVEVSDLGVKRISNLGVQSGRWVMDWIDQLRNYMIRVFRVNLAEPMASLMTGIVGGVKENFDEGFYQALIATGTLHVIAASGYNITMVAKVLMESLAPILGRKRALGVSLVGVVGYVILAGANPAVMRAGLMGGLVFAAQFWGREYLASWGLVITSGVMVLVAPWLITDVSFQLSVAATAGILWGEAPLRRGISKIQVPRYKKSSPTWRKIAGVLVDDLSTTLAATLATLPITAITFGRLSLISPVVNVLVLWLVPPMMAFGGVMLLLGVVSGYLAGLVGWLAWPLLALFVGVVEIFSSLPWASVDLVGLNWWIGAGWWLLLIAWWDRRGGSRR